MWLSMTGYGAAERATGDRSVRVEIRSVNQKNREVRVFSSPRNLAWEYEVQQALTRGLARGKIDAYITVSASGAAGGLAPSAMHRLRGRLLHLRLHLGAGQTAIAGRFAAESNDAEPLAQDIVLATAADALAELCESRGREGAGLLAVVAAQHNDIAAGVARIVGLKPEESGARQKLLAEKFAALRAGGLAEADRRRLEEELTYQLIRADVTEEVDRIGIHLGALATLLKEASPVGKQLDMLAQELSRETHTLASKSTYMPIKDEALKLRTIVDQLREQVQNIE